MAKREKRDGVDRLIERLGLQRGFASKYERGPLHGQPESAKAARPDEVKRQEDKERNG